MATYVGALEVCSLYRPRTLDDKLKIRGVYSVTILKKFPPTLLKNFPNFTIGEEEKTSSGKGIFEPLEKNPHPGGGIMTEYTPLVTGKLKGQVFLVRILFILNN